MAEKNQERPDLQHEGREKASVDIDRMINEGLSGGSVHMREGSTNIEEAHDFPKEEKPSLIYWTDL